MRPDVTSFRERYHLRRILLWAEPQVGKTNVYIYLLRKLLEIVSERERVEPVIEEPPAFETSVFVCASSIVSDPPRDLEASA